MSDKKYLKTRLQSIQFALEGIKYVFITQQNARIHAGFTLAVLILGFIVRISRMEWIGLLLTIGLVWAAELLNTAVEIMMDIVAPEQNPAVKIGKDVSAGGVIVSAFISIVVGLLIFGPPLWGWITGIFSHLFQ
ncbi:MAG: diacylglycerol kinase family protein [Anaerolineales bacterium]